MKKLTYLIFSIVALAFVSCDNYLDRPAKTSSNDDIYWVSEDNVRLFVNGAYTNYFVGYNSGWGSVYAPAVYSNREYSDDATTTGKQSNLLASIPDDNWYQAEGNYWLVRTGAGPWNFAWIRKWNLLIDRVAMMHEQGIFNDEQFNHWTGVARFFRGFEYSRFVQSFGDVPYIDYVVESADFDSQYKPRDSRDFVMTKVMEDFDFAYANVRDAATEPNRVNKDVVAAFASRFMLFEGSWQIYHNNDAAVAKPFFEAAVRFAELVMNTGSYDCDAPFRTLFGSESNPGKEAIIYRSYAASQSLTHCIASYSNLNESQTSGANLSLLKAWICQDGKTYDQSGVDNVESWRIQDMIKTRDARFEATFWHEPTQANTSIYCTKFIDRIGPWYNVDGVEEALPAKYASMTNTNGAPVIRYAEILLNWIEAKAELAERCGGTAVTDADLEKSINEIRSRPLDDTAKAHGVQPTAKLTLAMVNSMNDPARTSDIQTKTKGYEVTGGFVPALLWEIRRERRMEFVFEHMRTLDIRRWGQLELMQGSINPDILVGAWVDFNETKNLKKSFNLLTAAQFGVLKVLTDPDKAGDESAYVTFNGEQDGEGNILTSNAAEMVGFRIPNNIQDRDEFSDRNYLEPICNDVVNQYEDRGYAIEQNPGW